MKALCPQRHFRDVPQNVKDGTGYKETKLAHRPPTCLIGTLTHGCFNYCNDPRMVRKLWVQAFLNAQQIVVLLENVRHVSDLTTPGIKLKAQDRTASASGTFDQVSVAVWDCVTANAMAARAAASRKYVYLSCSSRGGMVDVLSSAACHQNGMSSSISERLLPLRRARRMAVRLTARLGYS
jgi:hypothetical protein